MLYLLHVISILSFYFQIFSQQSFLDSAFDEFHGNICSLFDILSLDQMVEVTVGWFKHKLDKRIMLLDMVINRLSLLLDLQGNIVFFQPGFFSFRSMLAFQNFI